MKVVTFFALLLVSVNVWGDGPSDQTLPPNRAFLIVTGVKDSMKKGSKPQSSPPKVEVLSDGGSN